MFGRRGANVNRLSPPPFGGSGHEGSGGDLADVDSYIFITNRMSGAVMEDLRIPLIDSMDM